MATTTDSLQQAQLNDYVVGLKAERSQLTPFKTATAKTLSAAKVNRQNYSLARVFAGNTDGVEGEVSKNIERANPSFQTNGLLVPMEVLKRDLSAGTTTQLISQNLRGPSIVDGLRPFSPIVAAGVEIVEMPVAGNYQFPREQVVPTVAWASSENQTLTPTTGAPTFDQTAGTNFRRASSVLYVSRQLVQQAQVSEGIEAFLARELRRTVATAISQAVINGNGTTQPLGLANYTPGSGSVNSITINNPTTWAEIVAADATVENLNAYAIDGTNAWLVNPNTKQSWAQTPKTATALTNGFLLDFDTKTANGHPTFATTECQNVALFSTRWSSVLVLLAGSVSILVDPYTQAAANQVRIVTDVLLDVVVRRPEAICIATTSF
jgi:HK97 family phage major capsid protein